MVASSHHRAIAMHQACKWSRTWPTLIRSICAPSPTPMRQISQIRCASSASTASTVQGQEEYNIKVQRQDMPSGKSKLRLDAFLASQLSAGHAASRAKVASAIKAGQVTVNGKVVSKASLAVSPGDQIQCILLPGPSLEAMPEDIALDIVYEDEHLMVINKPAGMAVHISPGHHTGTLVNALLHHCGLPGVRIDPTYPSNLPSVADDTNKQQGADVFQVQSLQGFGSDGVQSSTILRGWVMSNTDEESYEDEDEEDGFIPETSAAQSQPQSQEASQSTSSKVEAPGAISQPQQAQHIALLPGSSQSGVIRPGIVHRLDIGTSGLLVVAKREQAQRALAAQFKERTVGRFYQSITIGCPANDTGKVMTNIDRDPNDRKRMAALAYGSAKGRTAVSNYTVVKSLGSLSNAALVQWKLETGRTHQIRVHAKHIGHSLIGDVTYGGGGNTAVNAMKRGKSTLTEDVRAAILAFSRPALHARSLAFDHPVNGKRLSFEVDMPSDMQQLMRLLDAQ